MEHLATRTLHVSRSHPWETGTPEVTHSANVLQSHNLPGHKAKAHLSRELPREGKGNTQEEARGYHAHTSQARRIMKLFPNYLQAEPARVAKHH